MGSNSGVGANRAATSTGTNRPNAFYSGEKSFGRLVFFLSRNYQAYLDTVVEPYGISSAHVPLLAYLWGGEAGDTQNDIARFLAVDKGTVSRNVAALVRLGLVTQTASKRDSRACVVQLTEKGWELAEPIAALSAAWSEAVGEGIADEARKAIREQLEKMCERAEALVADVHSQKVTQAAPRKVAATVTAPSAISEAPASA